MSRTRILGTGGSAALLAASLLMVLAGTTLGAKEPPPGRTWVVSLHSGALGGNDVARPRVGPLGQPSRGAVIARARATTRAIERLEGVHGFEATFRYRYALQGFAASLTDAQVTALRRSPAVASMVPDRPMEPALDVVPIGLERVHARVTVGEPDVPADVAVIDTGVGPPADPTQQGELNVQGGVNCSRDGQGAKAYGDFWFIPHGTHVAGTIAARSNDRGVVGIAPGARLWSVRVFDRFGGGSTATVICGVDWAAAWQASHPGRRLVANMSLSGFDIDHSPDSCALAAASRVPDPLHLAICGAVEEQRVIIVAAAGNDHIDTDQSVPARYPQVIAVSALSDFDGLPGRLSSQDDVDGCEPPAGRERDDAFSRYSNFGTDVDVGAPGTCVLSVRRSGAQPGGTLLMSGTSMASPHVTGAVARFLAQPGNENVSPARMRRLLIATGSLDWATETDPDHHPDRLLDVEALLAPAPGLLLWPTTRELSSRGSGEQVIVARLQRVGGYAGRVELSVDGLPTGVDAPAPVVLAGLDGLTATLRLRVHAAAPEGDHALTVRATADGGTLFTDTPVTLRIDRTRPIVGTPWPQAHVVQRGIWRGSASIRLAWSASDPGGRVDQTILQARVGSGAWRTVTTRAARGHAIAVLTGGREHQFRVRATDGVGNIGTSDVLSTRLVRRDSSSDLIAWSGSWRTRSSARAAGRSLRTSSSPGASAEMVFTGRAVALVSPTAPGEGRARVLIDAVEVATIDLRSANDRARRIVFASGALAPGRHRITIEVVRGRVEVDALLVLR